MAIAPYRAHIDLKDTYARTALDQAFASVQLPRWVSSTRTSGQCRLGHCDGSRHKPSNSWRSLGRSICRPRVSVARFPSKSSTISFARARPVASPVKTGLVAGVSVQVLCVASPIVGNVLRLQCLDPVVTQIQLSTTEQGGCRKTTNHMRTILSLCPGWQRLSLLTTVPGQLPLAHNPKATANPCPPKTPAANGSSERSSAWKLSTEGHASIACRRRKNAQHAARA